MPEQDTPRPSQFLEGIDAAVKRGSEVLPSMVSGTTGQQPPVALIPQNPAVKPESPSGEGSGNTSSDK